MLHAENLSKSYHGKCAVNQVSLSVHSGQITGLLGPNGAGKSTVLRMLNRILIPDSGNIQFKQKPLTVQSVQRFGYLPEERGLYRKMKAGEQVMFFAALKGLSRKSCREQALYWFDRLHLMPLWNTRIEQLSKGNQQKIQFITTVVHGPDVLILDEPFSGFDPVNVEQITRELIQFKGSGKAIILSTHNMENAETLCDRIEMMHLGNHVISGGLSELQKNQATHSYLIEYRGLPMAFANALWASAEILHQEPNVQAETHRVIIRVSEGHTIRTIIQHINQSVELVFFKVQVPTLREMFMNQIQNPAVPYA